MSEKQPDKKNRFRIPRPNIPQSMKSSITSISNSVTSFSRTLSEKATGDSTHKFILSLPLSSSNKSGKENIIPKNNHIQKLLVVAVLALKDPSITAEKAKPMLKPKYWLRLEKGSIMRPSSCQIARKGIAIFNEKFVFHCGEENVDLIVITVFDKHPITQQSHVVGSISISSTDEFEGCDDNIVDKWFWINCGNQGMQVRLVLHKVAIITEEESNACRSITSFGRSLNKRDMEEFGRIFPTLWYNIPEYEANIDDGERSSIKNHFLRMKNTLSSTPTPSAAII